MYDWNLNLLAMMLQSSRTSRCIMWTSPNTYLGSIYRSNRVSWKLFVLDRNTFIYIRKLSWPTVVEGDPKVSFSLASMPRCWGGELCFSLDCFTYPWSVPCNAECQARKHQLPFFLVFVMTPPRVEPRSLCKLFVLKI